MQLTARQREFRGSPGRLLPVSITLGAVFGHFQTRTAVPGMRPGRRHRHCDLLHDPSARVRGL